MADKDILSRLADAGEEAISKLSQAPGAERMTGAIGGLRDRIDELQKRMTGLEKLERRVEALEARIAEPPVKAPARRRTARKPSAAGTTRTRTPRASAKKPKPAAPESGGADSAARTGGESPG